MGHEELHTGSSLPSCLPEECMTLTPDYIASFPIKKIGPGSIPLSVSLHTWTESRTAPWEEGFLGLTCAAVHNIRDHLHESVSHYFSGMVRGRIEEEI